MYEQIEAHGSTFNDLQKSLADPGKTAQVNAIRAALEATAEQIGSAQGTTDLDRNNLARLYRGFLAASRVVGHLQDKYAASRA